MALPIYILIYPFIVTGLLATTPAPLTKYVSHAGLKVSHNRTPPAHRAIKVVGQDRSWMAQRTAAKPLSTKQLREPELKTDNEPPKVDIDILEGNKTFFFPKKAILYAVQVVDLEDGSLADGRISPDRVIVLIDYVSKRSEASQAAFQTRTAHDSPLYATAQRLIFESDCPACHSINKPGVGPTYEQIAQKYRDDSGAIDRLARKVIAGGKGVWGEATMSPHPQLSLENASTLVTYMLSFSGARSTATVLPASGSYLPVIPEADDSDGYFRLKASYTDRGTQSAGPVKSEKVLIFRNPVLLPDQADWINGNQSVPRPTLPFNAVGPNSSLGYSRLDMTNITHLEVKTDESGEVIGGTLGVRLDSLTGLLIGQTLIDKSHLLSSVNSNLAKNKGILIDMLPTTGMHTLFFTFQNPQASPQQVLMRINSFVVKSGSASTTDR